MDRELGDQFPRLPIGVEHGMVSMNRQSHRGNFVIPRLRDPRGDEHAAPEDVHRDVVPLAQLHDHPSGAAVVPE